LKTYHTFTALTFNPGTRIAFIFDQDLDFVEFVLVFIVHAVDFIG